MVISGRMRISRRKLARTVTGVVAGAAAVSTAAAQAPRQPADAELEAARSVQRVAAETIARVPLPVTTEPAVQFKA